MKEGDLEETEGGVEVAILDGFGEAVDKNGISASHLSFLRGLRPLRLPR